MESAFIWYLLYPNYAADYIKFKYCKLDVVYSHSIVLGSKVKNNIFNF